MATEPTPTDAELAAMRAEFGITSNGRGIKEFTQVRDFAHAILARWGAQPAPAASQKPLTAGQIREMERNHVYSQTATLTDFARAIERAHGIGIKET